MIFTAFYQTIFEGQAWTFKDLEDYSNRVANYFLRAGYKPGQCIALFMENRPEYVGLWLGCSKIGLVPALINSNLAGQSLLHSINAACARGMIFGREYFKNTRYLAFLASVTQNTWPSAILVLALVTPVQADF